MWCERVEGLGIFPLDGQMRRMLVREIQRDRDIVELQKCPAFIDIADFDIEIGAIPVQGLPYIGYGNRNVMKSFHEVNFPDERQIPDTLFTFRPRHWISGSFMGPILKSFRFNRAG